LPLFLDWPKRGLDGDELAHIFHCQQTHQLTLVSYRHGVTLTGLHLGEGNFQHLKRIHKPNIALHHLSYQASPLLLSQGDEQVAP